jgi:nitrate reductase beta subunit
MDAFLVPLPATTSGSAPENKQFYLLYFSTLCWHAINISCENPCHHLQAAVYKLNSGYTLFLKVL